MKFPKNFDVKPIIDYLELWVKTLPNHNLNEAFIGKGNDGRLFNKEKLPADKTLMKAIQEAQIKVEAEIKKLTNQFETKISKWTPDISAEGIEIFKKEFFDYFFDIISNSDLFKKLLDKQTSPTQLHLKIKSAFVFHIQGTWQKDNIAKQINFRAKTNIFTKICNSITTDEPDEPRKTVRSKIKDNINNNLTSNSFYENKFPGPLVAKIGDYIKKACESNVKEETMVKKISTLVTKTIMNVTDDVYSKAAEKEFDVLLAISFAQLEQEIESGTFKTIYPHDPKRAIEIPKEYKEIAKKGLSKGIENYYDKKQKKLDKENKKVEKNSQKEKQLDLYLLKRTKSSEPKEIRKTMRETRDLMSHDYNRTMSEEQQLSNIVNTETSSITPPSALTMFGRNRSNSIETQSPSLSRKPSIVNHNTPVDNISRRTSRSSRINFLSAPINLEEATEKLTKIKDGKQEIETEVKTSNPKK